MNVKNIVVAFALMFSCNTIQAQHKAQLSTDYYQDHIKQAEVNICQLQQNVKNLKRDIQHLTIGIDSLKKSNGMLMQVCDNLQAGLTQLTKKQDADKQALSQNLVKTGKTVLSTNESVSMRTFWGITIIIILVLIVGGIVAFIIRKIKSGSSSLDEVRAVQEALQKAQTKLQEESVSLDNKLIEILSKQSILAPTTSDNGEVDHSLTLKVADEIVKIEMNLSRMDPSVKGYKQLAKGVQRIKDNFKANDYDIVDMLGKQYQPGMKAAVTFITDESLAAGQQIITRIIKPQVNYKQIMIQAAQIEVSQSD